MASILNPRSARQQAHGIVRAPIQPTEQPAPVQPPVSAAQPDIVRPTDDHAYRILKGIPDDVMSMDSKADAWQHYYDARDSKDLVNRLMNFDAPLNVKHDLYEAKKNFSDPVPTPMDRATDAVHRISALDPRVLEIAESHPNILKSLMASLQGEN